MPVDLNTCVPGQKLRSRHGWIMTYKGKDINKSYCPHMVIYPNGGACGSRTDDGFVYSSPDNRDSDIDHDIVEILSEITPMNSAQKVPRFHAVVDGATVFLKDAPDGNLVRINDIISLINERLSNACDPSETDTLRGLLTDIGA